VTDYNYNISNEEEQDTVSQGILLLKYIIYFKSLPALNS